MTIRHNCKKILLTSCMGDIGQGETDTVVVLLDVDREFWEQHTNKHPFYDDDTSDNISYFDDIAKDSRNLKAIRAATYEGGKEKGI